MITIVMVNLIAIKFDLIDTKDSPFYDPIAAEVSKLSDVDNIDFISKQNTRISKLQEIYRDIINKLQQGKGVGETTFIVESGEIKKVVYDWEISKNNELKKNMEQIEFAERFKNESKYKTTRRFLDEKISLLKKERVSLEEYDKSIQISKDVNYSILYKSNKDYMIQHEPQDGSFNEMEARVKETSDANSQLVKILFANQTLLVATNTQTEVINLETEYLRNMLFFTKESTKIFRIIPGCFFD